MPSAPLAVPATSAAASPPTHVESPAVSTAKALPKTSEDGEWSTPQTQIPAPRTTESAIDSSGAPLAITPVTVQAQTTQAATSAAMPGTVSPAVDKSSASAVQQPPVTKIPAIIASIENVFSFTAKAVSTQPTSTVDQAAPVPAPTSGPATAPLLSGNAASTQTAQEAFAGNHVTISTPMPGEIASLESQAALSTLSTETVTASLEITPSSTRDAAASFSTRSAAATTSENVGDFVCSRIGGCDSPIASVSSQKAGGTGSVASGAGKVQGFGTLIIGMLLWTFLQVADAVAHCL